MSSRPAAAQAANDASDEDLGFLCREAGPGGDDACGTTCESFCTLMMGACPPENTSSSYPSYDACIADCETLPQVAYAYGDGIFSGNTAQCRTFYAGFAAQGNSADCERAGGISVCVDPEPAPEAAE